MPSFSRRRKNSQSRQVLLANTFESTNTRCTMTRLYVRFQSFSETRGWGGSLVFEKLLVFCDGGAEFGKSGFALCCSLGFCAEDCLSSKSSVRPNLEGINCAVAG